MVVITLAAHDKEFTQAWGEKFLLVYEKNNLKLKLWTIAKGLNTCSLQLCVVSTSHTANSRSVSQWLSESVCVCKSWCGRTLWGTLGLDVAAPSGAVDGGRQELKDFSSIYSVSAALNMEAATPLHYWTAE